MGTSRRSFLVGGAALGAAAGLESFGFLSTLRPVSAQEAKLDPSLVRLDSGIEPTVKLLEETPRQRLVEEVATRVKNGLSYQDLLAALLLAGVRNVQPRPSVGFKFHAVLVVNSAHIASLASPDEERWLPIFWALDYFKSAQLQTANESGWRMKPIDEAKLPSPAKAVAAFTDAMEKWDEEAADAAAAQLARTVGMNEAFELMVRFGCRDFRDIGHKAIYVANAFRTLHAIGWQHAEPVLRSLAYALLKHDGQNPAQLDLAPDRPGRKNAELAGKIRPDWLGGKRDPEAAQRLLSMFRTASAEEACDAVLAALNDGVGPGTVWDAMLGAAGEMMMRASGIVALHSVTTSNALHYAFATSASETNRKMALLQNAAFLPLFRDSIRRGGNWEGVEIDRFDSAPVASKPADAIGEIFAEASRNRASAACKALGYLEAGNDAGALITTARRLIFAKGTNSHDYKYSSAVLEDYHTLSPAIRDRFLASSLYYLKGSGGNDNAVVRRAREALA